MDPWEYRDFTRSAGAVALFISNFYFWDEGTYFAPTGDERPLLHTWSLGIEEQFYLLFPIFLIVMWRFGPRAIFWTVVSFLVAGLALAEAGSRHSPNATFYLPHTRIWELDIGVLCALLAPRLAGRQSNLLSLLGLLLICIAVFGFDEHTPFPSLFALVPTLGTALVILFSGTGTITARLLSAPPLVWLGLISYSAYLWHQPLFAFARIRGLDGTFVTTTLIGTTFLLAYMSWRFIESPFRGSHSWLSRRAMFSLGGIGSALLITYAAAGYLRNDFETPSTNLAAHLRKVIGQPATAYRCPNPKGLIDKYYRTCTLENAPHRKRIALFGDSHAAAMLPAFHRLSIEKGFDLSVGLRLGCPPLLKSYVHRTEYSVNICHEVVTRQWQTVVDEQIDIVFLVARWSFYDGAEKTHLLSDRPDRFNNELAAYREQFKQLVANTMAEYRSRGVEVFVVLQVPQQVVSGRTLYRSLYFRDLPATQANEIISRNSVTRAAHLDKQRAVNALIAKAGVDEAHRIDLTNAFCGDEYCLIGDTERARYSDHDHLSPNGAAIAYEALSTLPALATPNTASAGQSR